HSCVQIVVSWKNAVDRKHSRTGCDIYNPDTARTDIVGNGAVTLQELESGTRLLITVPVILAVRTVCIRISMPSVSSPSRTETGVATVGVMIFGWNVL